MFVTSTYRTVNNGRKSWGFGLVIGSTVTGEHTNVFPLGAPGPGLIGYLAFGPWIRSFGIAWRRAASA